jgi:hypothetical protein
MIVFGSLFKRFLFFEAVGEEVINLFDPKIKPFVKLSKRSGVNLIKLLGAYLGA